MGKIENQKSYLNCGRSSSQNLSSAANPNLDDVWRTQEVPELGFFFLPGKLRNRRNRSPRGRGNV
ncbi:hypothetical protein H6P81_005775 [Aristolochia fimbriata]|uniref:Uncharacterized protein n=1 Tax=Aristolochia fimbriata TaxID=158543 RepID=A0AAV7EWJ9_ARIFI|nr:hypothetical protein H6P81_005775 [Aristolochia fimbriata]